MICYTILHIIYIVSFNANWCTRLCDDLSLIKFIIKHIIHNQDNRMFDEYHILLQFMSNNISIRKLPQLQHLVSNFVDCIICENQSDDAKLPKLIIIYNIISYVQIYTINHTVQTDT